MASKRIITKEMIIDKALEISKQKGISAINARSLAKALNCSTQPIYWSFKNMEELKKELLYAINNLYHLFIDKQLAMKKYPEYKAYGIGYITFAREEPQLFQLLFMRNRKEDEKSDEDRDFLEIIEMIMNNYHLDYEKAYRFHLQMWIYVHGLATQIATGYISWDEDTVSKLLTESFQALEKHYRGEDNYEHDKN